MTEKNSSNAGNFLPPTDTAEIENTIAEVRVIDPELLERPDARMLVEMGSRFGVEVTKRFGTPDRPIWASGTSESSVLMSYHNGGHDGHTSVGPNGVGVPRNALLLAKAVNEAAGFEVYDPLTRARSFYESEAHDWRQLCGRTLMPEGQGHGHGDERLSAKEARDRYMAAGGSLATGRRIYRGVMATAFNPDTGAQNVDYTGWLNNPDDQVLLYDVLGQELTAGADLLGAAYIGPDDQRRGPLGVVEYSVESMCLVQKNGIIQARLRAHGLNPASVKSFETMLEVIELDETLRTEFINTIAGQAQFLADYLKYSDQAIRRVCGKGIDDLFPGRLQNAAVMAEYTTALRKGASPRAIWLRARKLAGYDNQ